MIEWEMRLWKLGRMQGDNLLDSEERRKHLLLDVICRRCVHVRTMLTNPWKKVVAYLVKNVILAANPLQSLTQTYPEAADLDWKRSIGTTGTFANRAS
jgi:hypothetical protein